MAKIRQSKNVNNAESVEKGLKLPLVKMNYIVLGLGVLALIIGYILMGIADDPDAFISRTLSPIILVVTYTVIIPIGIFYREKK